MTWTDEDEAKFQAWMMDFYKHFNALTGGGDEELCCDGFWIVNGAEEDYLAYSVYARDDMTDEEYNATKNTKVRFDFPEVTEAGWMYLALDWWNDKHELEEKVGADTSPEDAAKRFLAFLEKSMNWLVEKGYAKYAFANWE